MLSRLADDDLHLTLMIRQFEQALLRLVSTHDQIVNVAAKSASMSGRQKQMSVVVRCPASDRDLQKHFLGVPDLFLFEMSPLHDNLAVLQRMLDLGRPCLFFENEPAERTFTPGVIDELFVFHYLDVAHNWARVAVRNTPGCLLIVPGGLVSRAMAAARQLLTEHEIDVTIVVPSQLYPFVPEPILFDVRRAAQVLVVEESTPGGSWGNEVAQSLYELCWKDLKQPIGLIQSRSSLQSGDIVERVVLG